MIAFYDADTARMVRVHICFHELNACKTVSNDLNVI